MTALAFLTVAIVVGAGVLLYVVRRTSRDGSAQLFDLGAVSTRWLAELRRDEPWSRS